LVKQKQILKLKQIKTQNIKTKIVTESKFNHLKASTINIT